MKSHSATRASGARISIPIFALSYDRRLNGKTYQSKLRRRSEAVSVAAISEPTAGAVAVNEILPVTARDSRGVVCAKFCTAASGFAEKITLEGHPLRTTQALERESIFGGLSVCDQLSAA